MNEITKLYENAGIAPKKCSECDNNMDCGFGKDCYSPFTAEKQIELIKWLANYERFCCWKFKPTNEWVIYDDTYMVDSRDIANSDFEECLASWIVCIWQDLTVEEKQQIKEILE